MGAVSKPPRADTFEHYLRGTPISPRPGRVTLDAAHQGRGTSLERILFLVLASCSLPERVQQLSRTWCGDHHPGVRCSFYLDCERLPVETPPPAGLITLVPASAYTPAQREAVPERAAAAALSRRLLRRDGAPSASDCEHEWGSGAAVMN